MPVVGSSAYNTAGQITSLVRSLLNDAQSNLFTDTVLLPYANSAYRKAQHAAPASERIRPTRFWRPRQGPTQPTPSPSQPFYGALGGRHTVSSDTHTPCGNPEENRPNPATFRLTSRVL